MSIPLILSSWPSTYSPDKIWASELGKTPDIQISYLQSPDWLSLSICLTDSRQVDEKNTCCLDLYENQKWSFAITRLTVLVYLPAWLRASEWGRASVVQSCRKTMFDLVSFMTLNVLNETNQVSLDNIQLNSLMIILYWNSSYDSIFNLSIDSVTKNTIEHNVKTTPE